jgi:hypothetical protein
MSDLSIGGKVGAAYFNQRLDALKSPQRSPGQAPVSFEDGLAEFKADFDEVLSKKDVLFNARSNGDVHAPGVGSLKQTADGCTLQMFEKGSFGMAVAVSYAYNRDNETVTVDKTLPSPFPSWNPAGNPHEHYTLNLKDRTVSDHFQNVTWNFPNDKIKFHPGPEGGGMLHRKMLVVDEHPIEYRPIMGDSNWSHEYFHTKGDNWGYPTLSHDEVDPRFGTRADYEAFKTASKATDPFNELWDAPGALGSRGDTSINLNALYENHEGEPYGGREEWRALSDPLKREPAQASADPRFRYDEHGRQMDGWFEPSVKKEAPPKFPGYSE